MNKKEINILVDCGFNDYYLKYLNTNFKVKNVFTLSDVTTGKITSTKDIDLVVFTGGADVNPSLYREDIGKYTSISEQRDKENNTMFSQFNNVPKLGICRGAQYLTVKSGGKLIQHVEGHGKDHEIEIIDKNGKIRTFFMTSTHHQMMFPYNMNEKNYKILGWSKVYNSNVYLNGNNEQIELPDDFLEPEIVFYPNTRSLCIQGHPEYGNCENKTRTETLNLLEELIYDK